MADLELEDIQGLITTGYGHLPATAYIFLRVDDPKAAGRWLATLADQVTSSRRKQIEGKAEKPEFAVNVAVSSEGLKALGLAEAELATFPHEFVDGMDHPPRPRRFGDTGGSAPEHWDYGGTPAPTRLDLHILLILQARGQGELDQLCAEHEARWQLGQLQEVVQPRQVGYLPPDQREHFGYHDSISQPEIEGSPNQKQTQSVAKAGEFILGYENEYGVLPLSPTVAPASDPANHLPAAPPINGAPPARDLGRNGSYLVFRKLAQDVAGFRRYLRSQSTNDEEAEALGAKIMGRWPGGAPLAIADHDDPTLSLANNFGYATEDPFGFRCPMGAHVRRANPRDLFVGSPSQSQEVVNRHRIMRRGVIYGDRLPPGTDQDDGIARGLLFVAINASIERQFEFIQQTWINNPKFGGLYNDRDPILGANADPTNPTDTGPWTMTIPHEAGRRLLHNVPRFVTVRGGAYFFLPSIRAIRYLAHRTEG